MVGPLPNGTTQVLVGRQALSLQLPQAPVAGSVLTLSVQQVEGQLRLTLLSVLPPGGGGTTPVAQGAAPASNMPATSVHLSPAALSGNAVPVSPSVSTAGAAGFAGGAAPSVAQAAVEGPVRAAPASGAVMRAGSVSVGQAALSSAAIAAASPAIAAPMPGASRVAEVPVANAASVNIAGLPNVARPAIPYPLAGPAQSPGQAPASSSAAVSATLPPLGQAVGASVVGQHSSAPNLSSAMPVGQVTAPAAAPAATASNPQVALLQMVQQSLPRQDSIVGLTTALASLAGRAALPEPVLKAAQQVLALRLNLDGGPVDGAALQKAVQRSGLFQEALLASGQGKAAGGDLKTALLGLQQRLGAWLGNQAPVEQVGSVAPPLRGQVPRARGGGAMPAELPSDPQELGKVLLERTEAALSRVRLHQNASLPEPAARHDAQWSLDLPVTIAGQQNLLQLQIYRDAEGEQARPEERGWQVRFAINLSESGEVGAQISLRGKATGVLIWAEQAETAAMLAEGVDALRGELEAVGLMPGAVLVREGAPAAAPGPAAPSGHVVDATR
ncbi:MAG: hypothetical protein ABS75_32975 [Pelagibacterium sp. SCN 63-23]|nr:MAG: hypothetical protein ABS75_32975 [Pelagibacterium sp. SCN 63-23]